jgi:hypothetical protein
MKITWAAGMACTLLLVAACRKHDYCPEPPHQSQCELTQSTTSFGPGDYTPQYRKEYDASGRVTKVVAALYSLVLNDSIALLLHYNGNDVYFLSEENSADTVLVASFDASSHLTSMIDPKFKDDEEYQFEPATEFGYANGKLSRITRHISYGFLVDLYTTYDANGNVIRIHETNNDANAGTFFTYDLTVTATAQFYSDQFGSDFLNNQVYLAEFLGWLPDLIPVNRRTSFRHVFNDEDTTDDEPGYVFNNTVLKDHVYDGEGKLLSYKIANGQITFTNTWNCTVEKN